MKKINPDRFLTSQPPIGRGKGEEIENKYIGIADRLYRICLNSGLTRIWNEEIMEGLAICLTGYLQDVVADAGLWRSFITVERELHGRTLPYFDISDDYIDFELNPEDVRFLTWYYLSQSDSRTRLVPPDDGTIEKLAGRLYAELEDNYMDAEESPAWLFARELDLKDPADQEQIIKIGNWIYINSYLMSPVSTINLRLAAESVKGLKTKDPIEISRLLGEAIIENPTGPLALYMREWVNLIFENRLPKEDKKDEPKEEHPTYTKFISATGGEPIAFFRDHAELNRFLTEKLGWKDDEEHFVQLKDERDMVLMVNPVKGMLIARNVAQCIKYPGNTLYNETIAKKEAIELLTQRGRCPADLLKFVCGHGALPDAAFPGEKSRLALGNWDFTARCYLQLYYRGD